MFRINIKKLIILSKTEGESCPLAPLLKMQALKFEHFPLFAFENKDIWVTVYPYYIFFYSSSEREERYFEIKELHELKPVQQRMSVLSNPMISISPRSG